MVRKTTGTGRLRQALDDTLYSFWNARVNAS